MPSRRVRSRGVSPSNAYLLQLIEREVARPTVKEVLDRAARRAEHATVSALDVIAVARAEREELLHRRSSS